MSNDKIEVTGGQPTSPYAARPWLSRYGEGIPSEIKAEYTNMLDLFRAAVQRAPGAVVIKYFDGEVNLAELDARSDALAVALIANGFGAGDRLGLYVQNNPAFVYGLIAAWKAGGFGVAINPMNKARELTYLLADSGATVLLCLDDLYTDVAQGVLAAGGVQVKTIITCSGFDDQTRNDSRLFSGSRAPAPEGVLDLSVLLDQFAGQSPPLHMPSRDDTAILTYTSGTTGDPKGAMITHRGMAFNAQTYRDWMGITNEDVILGVAPLFHVTGLVAGIALALLVGCPLVLNHRFESGVVMDAIREHHPTFTVGSITVFINLSSTEGVTRGDWASFRTIYSGGAAIAPAVTEQFLEKTGIYIHSVYGLTETTSPSHCVPLGVRAPVDPASGALSVGLPTFNTDVRILDEEGAEVPVGEIGEIAIAGPQVVPGYWRKPEATASSLPGGELRTGDVGFMDEAGWFYVVDRKKDMINASGYKVWPREVEDVLYSHPAVLEAAVVGVPDEYRGETVKAFVSLKSGETVTEAELIAFCKEEMAAYKYPRSIDFVSELPKTASGKILRRELRATTS